MVRTEWIDSLSKGNRALSKRKISKTKFSHPTRFKRDSIAETQEQQKTAGEGTKALIQSRKRIVEGSDRYGGDDRGEKQNS